MLSKLTYDPRRKPTHPNSIMATSFHKIQFPFPSLSGQKVTISINGGNIKAKAELLKAPTKDMTAPRFGMAIAKPKVMSTRTVRTKYSPICWAFSLGNSFLTAGQTMLKGT